MTNALLMTETYRLEMHPMARKLEVAEALAAGISEADLTGVLMRSDYIRQDLCIPERLHRRAIERGEAADYQMGTAQTTAQVVADIFENDGSKFKRGGISLDETCSSRGGSRSYAEGDLYAWDFRDGSRITVCGGAWDLGYADCYCWQGGGHVEDCENSDATK